MNLFFTPPPVIIQFFGKYLNDNNCLSIDLIVNVDKVANVSSILSS